MGFIMFWKIVNYVNSLVISNLCSSAIIHLSQSLPLRDVIFGKDHFPNLNEKFYSIIHINMYFEKDQFTTILRLFIKLTN